MITIGIVEDHPVFRQGLAQLVERVPDFALAGAYRSVEDFVAASSAPQVVLLDLNLPGVDGSEGVRTVCGRGCQVLVVSASTERDAVLDAIAAGASGYLSKDTHPEEIATAIITVAGGATYVSATLAAYLLEAGRVDNTAHALQLSAREQDVLTLLAQGERDSDIAEKLFISVRTVRSHLDRIRDKTGQRRRPDLTRYAIEHGLLDSSGDAGRTRPAQSVTRSRSSGDQSIAAPADRVLATILYTDIVRSTEHAIELGDHQWRRILDRHDAALAREVERFRGRLVKSTGDGIIATFDGPARAIRCGRAIRDAAVHLGLEVRVGLHAAEIEIRGDDIGGIAVHIAQRICAFAEPNEVVVSSTVPPVVAGSGISFRNRGTHALKGVPDAWRIYAVEG